MLRTLRELYRLRFPIRRMRLNPVENPLRHRSRLRLATGRRSL